MEPQIGVREKRLFRQRFWAFLSPNRVKGVLKQVNAQFYNKIRNISLFLMQNSDKRYTLLESPNGG